MTNAPDNFETYLLPDGELKYVEHLAVVLSSSVDGYIS